MSEGTFYSTKSYFKCFGGLVIGDLGFLFILGGGTMALVFFKGSSGIKFLTIDFSSSWTTTFDVGYVVDNDWDYDWMIVSIVMVWGWGYLRDG